MVSGSFKLADHDGKAGKQIIPENEKVEVWVSVEIQKVFDIDTSQQKFGLDCWVNVLYYDKRVLAWAQENEERKKVKKEVAKADEKGAETETDANGAEKEKDEKELYYLGKYFNPDTKFEEGGLDPIEYPQVHFLNSVDAQIVDEWIQLYEIPSKGSIQVARRVIGNFSMLPTSVDGKEDDRAVQLFPFDSQELKLQVFFTDQYKLLTSKDAPTCFFSVGKLLHNEWMMDQDIDEAIEEFHSRNKRKYTLYSVTLSCRRATTSYLSNYVLATSVLSFINISALVLDITELADRIQIVITIMLTHSALKIVLSDEVPKVSYHTVMDNFLLSNFVLTGMAGIEATWIAWLLMEDDSSADGDHSDRYKALYVLNEVFMYLYVILWALTHVFLVLAHRTSDDRTAKKMQDREAKKKLKEAGFDKGEPENEESETGVPRKLVVTDKGDAWEGDLEVGTMVYVNYKGLGKAFPAIIKRVHKDDNTVDHDYKCPEDGWKAVEVAPSSAVQKSSTEEEKGKEDENAQG